MKYKVISRITREEVSPKTMSGILDAGGNSWNFMLLPSGGLRLRVHVGSGYVFFPIDDTCEAVAL